MRHHGAVRCPVGVGSGCGTRPSPDGSAGSGRYLRVVEKVTRGCVGVAVTVAAFAAADALDGAVDHRIGVGFAGAWMLFLGTYCVLNFRRCRETHCAVTGPSWTLLGLLGLTSTLGPTVLGWYTVSIASGAFLVVLAAGYALEFRVLARTGRRTLR